MKIFLYVSFKTVEQKNKAKKLIKNDLSDLIIAEGSEQELELGFEISSKCILAAAKARSISNKILQLCVIVLMN